MPATTKGLPYPSSSDGIDIPGDLQSLAEATDSALDAYLSEALVEAKGDLLVGTAADTLTRLAVGANRKVLMADSAQAEGVKWAYPGQVLTGSASPSAATSFSIDDCFSSEFEFYLIRFRLIAASGSPVISARLRAASADDSTSNHGYSLVVDNPTVPASSLTTAQSSVAVALGSTGRTVGTIEVTDPATATATGFQSRYTAGITSPVQGWYGGFHNVASAFTGITFLASAGLTGIVRVYALPAA
jgi:hypothetical protein